MTKSEILEGLELLQECIPPNPRTFKPEELEQARQKARASLEAIIKELREGESK